MEIYVSCQQSKHLTSKYHLNLTFLFEAIFYTSSKFRQNLFMLQSEFLKTQMAEYVFLLAIVTNCFKNKYEKKEMTL